MALDLGDRRTIAGLGAGAVVLLLLLVFLVFGGGGDDPVASGTATPTPTVSESPSPMPSPSESEETTPPSPTPKETLPPVASKSGAFLLPAGADKDPRELMADECDVAFAVPGWPGIECDRLDMAGGAIYWVISTRPNGVGKDHRIDIRRFELSSEHWIVSWRAQETTASWVEAKVIGRDITDSGKLNAIVAVRSKGSSVPLQYDVLSWPSSTATLRVRFHRGPLAQGSLRAIGGGLEDYGARFDDGAPQCCPNFFNRTTIKFQAGEFRIVGKKKVKASAVSPSDV